VIQGNFNDPRAVVVNRERDMALYDMMPSAIRSAFANATISYNVVDVAQALVNGCPPAEALRFIQANESANWRAYRRTVGL